MSQNKMLNHIKKKQLLATKSVPLNPVHIFSILI